MRNHRENRPQQVGRIEEGVEVVVVDAGGLAVEPRRTEPGGQKRAHHRHAVQRDHHHHAGDDPGGHQVGDRPHGHHLERVDLVGDAHRAQLRGRARADRRGQADAGDGGGDDADIDICRDEARHRLHADAGQLVIALHGDDRARRQGEKADDDDGAADQRQRAGCPGSSGRPAAGFPFCNDRRRSASRARSWRRRPSEYQRDSSCCHAARRASQPREPVPHRCRHCGPV